MVYQIKSYFKFLLKSSNEHGIHSPFVYQLITKCFYNKSQFAEYTELKKYRQELLNDSSTIHIKDFGQGSRVFKSNERPVNAIARNAGITPKRQQLLFRMVNYLRSKSILEIGTSLGLATSAMALGNKTATVETVEGCPATAKKASEMFKKFNLQNIHLKGDTFEDFFAKKTSEKLDLVYIDGNHNKLKTLEYFEILLKYVHNDSILIFDDIYWSKEMTEAWQQIVNHPDVSVSIDTFFWGMVFFRKEQPKQHFCIRA